MTCVFCFFPMRLAGDLGWSEVWYWSHSGEARKNAKETPRVDTARNPKGSETEANQI